MEWILSQGSKTLQNKKEKEKTFRISSRKRFMYVISKIFSCEIEDFIKCWHIEQFIIGVIKRRI